MNDNLFSCIKCVPCLLLLQLLSPICKAQDTNRYDGPYVLYHGDQCIVQYINADNKPQTDSFPIAQKSQHPLAIHFSNHINWDFEVNFKKELEDEPAVWGRVDKALFLSDIEGEFEAFRNVLVSNGVMDTLYRWTYGTGNLVICGDLFDRGNDVVQELWLLYKLEQEAKEQGGYVHTILGNHDIMNMSGDLRYVLPKYFEHAKMLGRDYMEFYSYTSELGRWLRSKNIMEKIGDNLCMHAGVSPPVLALRWPLKKINSRCRGYYDQAEHPEKFTYNILWNFFDGDYSPFWYRGYFAGPNKAPLSQVDSTLDLYQCKRIIVGHTIVRTNPGSYYNGKVIGIDVDEHAGQTAGVLIEADKIYKIGLSGKKETLPSF